MGAPPQGKSEVGLEGVWKLLWGLESSGKLGVGDELKELGDGVFKA